MPFQANVLSIMIASPTDVAAERVVIAEAIHRWNNINAISRKLILQTIRWETHGAPRMGTPAQTVLNEELLVQADILVGIFGTRIGTATKEYVSGTVEEIKRHVAAGKLAMVYFSAVPVDPNTLDLEQWKLLQEFKAECQKESLYWDFESSEDLEKLFSNHLSIHLNSARFRWITPAQEVRASEQGKPKDEDLTILSSAASGDGTIIVSASLDGWSVVAGSRRYGNSSPREAAAVKRSLERLLSGGYISHESLEVYRVTEEGYSLADEVLARRALQLKMSVTGPPDSQVLLIEADMPVGVSSLSFATSSGAEVSQQEFHPEERTSARLGIDHRKVVELFNTPRPDASHFDLSGPGMIVANLEWRGRPRTVALPVVLQPRIVNNTQWISLTGGGAFTLQPE